MNELYRFASQPLSRDLAERRLQFGEINVIHFDGPHSPREWLFRTGSYLCFNKWVEDYLLPKYGTLDRLYKKTLQDCINHWENIWNVVQGSVSWFNKHQAANEGWIRGQLITCQPWVIDGLNIPNYENFCTSCSKYPLLSGSQDQEIVSIVLATPKQDHIANRHMLTPPPPPPPPERMSLQQVPPPPRPQRVVPPPPPPPFKTWSANRQQEQNLKHASTQVRKLNRPIGLAVTTEAGRRPRSRSLGCKRGVTRQGGSPDKRAIGARVSHSMCEH